ncbi:c-type cytochrome [Thalassobaculum sp. OXR-137]|uniref:c-type cytochrome n=1 Tax=Thalassobaculum sp. OXR-137 TaxID=3100173 RepID=UPI002AC934CA|nr:c-type cytochrome [Thalassobaculum sp. OXR-137]WPZ36797.1 c-type cytochrome [Thalassobaculum sp. OXR-137]
MLVRLSTAAALLISLALPGAAHAAGDAAAGKKLFVKCQACHSLADGKRKVGPSLYNLFQRKAGSFPGFSHSDDMVAAGATIDPWNAEHFEKYIVDPNGYIGSVIGKDKARTKMTFPGLKNKEEADDILAYLQPFFEGKEEGK